MHRVYTPIPSMYAIFAYIYHRSQPNVGKCTIHGWYGIFIYNIYIYKYVCISLLAEMMRNMEHTISDTLVYGTKKGNFPGLPLVPRHEKA